MKTRITLVSAIAVAGVLSAVAQQVPGAPEDNGLTPKTATVYVNSQATDPTVINNGNTESLGVAIANGGNVIVGWEDDDPNAPSVIDIEAVWTMYDSAGTSITPNTLVTNVAPDTAGSATTKFLSYFRANGSAVGGGHSWGPKIQANLFGDGVGMGAVSWQLDVEVPELAAYDGNNQGDYPTVQLVNNAGAPVHILTGVSAEYATRTPDSIRIADWGYLSNGNVVVVGESRQNQDLIDVYKGAEAWRHIIYRIVDKTNNVVKAEALVSESANQTKNDEMWHGVGITKDGFAVRWLGQTGVTVRMFDNSGTPTTTNINLAELTGHPEAGGGGRGDGAGFHGNGKDAYVAAASSGAQVWVTVLNTNGTVRYSKTVADDLTLASAGDTDAAIDADGNVIVVFTGKYDPNNNNLVMGRRFDAAGNPIGKTFYVSELELPDPGTPGAGGPRVAVRSSQVAIAWESTSDLGTTDPNTGLVKPVVALRQFSTFIPGSAESVGLTRLVPDTPIVKPAADALGNWEPYASVLGNSTFLVEGNTFAMDAPGVPSTSNQRFVVALQPVAGGSNTMKQVEGFYADNGQPFLGQINASRQNGNPGRVAGDVRPGAVHYMVGAEASPHVYPEFQSSDNRWNLGFDRLTDGRYGTIQIYSLDMASLTPTPLCKALDSANGRLTAAAGTPAGNQITRFGGEIVGLDNGNFVSVVQDNGHLPIRSDVDCVVATIFAPDGTVVQDSWVVSTNSDIWSNVAPFKGGFAIRCKPLDGSATRWIYFYDNAGNLLGHVDQADSGAQFDTGRGDGTRIFGHINSPYVYLTGRAANTQVVKVAVFDSRTQKFVAIADVNEGGFTGNFDRAFGAVDALDRLTIGWVSQPFGYANQQVAVRVLAFNGTTQTFTALTPSFFAFLNNATNAIRTLQMSVAMTTKQICVAAKGEINYDNKPLLGVTSPKEVNFFTVFSHPAPAEDPTTPVTVESPMLGTQLGAGGLTISWAPATAGFALEMTDTLTAPVWSAAPAGNPVTVPVTGASKYYRLKKP